MKISVIIPCFNENESIETVISAIQKSSYDPEVVVVDDGSINETKNILNKLENIKLITHLHNQGKAKAIKTGIKKAKGDVLVFIDADLTNFSTKNFDELVDLVAKKNFDMSLSDRENEYCHSRMSGFAIAYTGERALKSTIIKNNPSILDVSGYLIEPSINKLFFHKYSTAKVLFKNVGQLGKISKYGLKGIFKDADMWRKYIKFLGLREFLFQLKTARNLST